MNTSDFLNSWRQRPRDVLGSQPDGRSSGSTISWTGEHQSRVNRARSTFSRSHSSAHRKVFSGFRILAVSFSTDNNRLIWLSIMIWADIIYLIISVFESGACFVMIIIIIIFIYVFIIHIYCIYMYKNRTVKLYGRHRYIIEKAAFW